MNRPRRLENSNPWIDSPARGSEYLQGDFWAALRLEDDEPASHDIAAPPIFEGDGTLSPFVPEMKQVGPTSPLIFPVLGLDIKTPTTAVKHVSGTANEQEDYLTIAWDEEETVPAIQVDAPPKPRSELPVDPPRDQNQSSAEAKRPSRQVGQGFKAPPMLGPKPRPALPSLSSAPIVPSWRKRAASTSQAGPTIGIPDQREDQVRSRKDGNTFDSQLLDTLVDSAWSEPATPITPIDDTNDSIPYIAEDEHSWDVDRHLRHDVSPRYHTHAADLHKSVTDGSIPHGRPPSENHNLPSKPVMPHRSKALTPVSILKPSKYRAPEPSDWF